MRRALLAVVVLFCAIIFGDCVLEWSLGVRVPKGRANTSENETLAAEDRYHRDAGCIKVVCVFSRN